MRFIKVVPVAAAIVSVLIVLAIFGPIIANPQELGWLQGDEITNQYGWHQYRADASHLFPIVTDRGSYPLPMAVANFGTIPFIDLLLKLLSPILPAKLQYLGPVFVIGVALQAILGWAVLREATVDGRGAAYELSLFLGAVLFGTAPVMIVRFYYMHISLAMQWPILLSLLIYLRSYRVTYWRTIRDFSAVTAISAAIMPYTMMMVLLVYGAYIIKSIFDRSLDWPKYILMAIPLQCGLAVLLASGFLEVGGLGTFPAGGFGLFSSNFFSMIDPIYANFSSQFIPDLHVVGPGQYEGFGYVGVGVLFLFLVSALVSIANRRKPTVGSAGKFWPLIAVALVSFLWAMSNVMAFGTYVIEVPLPSVLMGFLQNFRSSGRFIAVVIYLLMFISISTLILKLKPKNAALVIIISAILQLVDLTSPFLQMHQRFSSRSQSKDWTERFTDPAYQSLGRYHDTLIILPPWQCREWHLPRPDYSPPNFIRFENLAMDENLRTNSFYGGRLPVIQGLYHCEVFLRKLQAQPADKRTAYILTSRTFALYGQHIAATHSCDFADGMFICRGDRMMPGLSDRARRQILLPASSPSPDKGVS